LQPRTDAKQVLLRCSDEHDGHCAALSVHSLPHHVQPRADCLHVLSVPISLHDAHVPDAWQA
jgi:hypothetical protein